MSLLACLWQMQLSQDVKWSQARCVISCCAQGHCIAHISVNCVTLRNLYLPGPLWLLMQHLPQDVQCTRKWDPLLNSKPEYELCFQFFIMLESRNLCRNVPFSHVSSSPPPPPPLLSSLMFSCHSFWYVSLNLMSSLKSSVDRFIITWLLLLFSWCSYTSSSGNWKENMYVTQKFWVLGYFIEV